MKTQSVKASSTKLDQDSSCLESQFKIESFVLGNGMKVIVNEDNSAKLISHYVVYNVGGLQDFHGKAGIAHFLEHLMFKSTKNFKEGELTKFLNYNGVSFNAGTGHELTVYYETSSNKYLEKIMELEADRMQNLIFNEAEINNERNIIKEERRMRVDNVIQSAFTEKLTALHYDSAYYGASLIGLMTDLDNIKLDDLESFYKQYYDPSNATLVLSGDVKFDDAKRLAEKYYGVLKNRTDKDFSKQHSLLVNPESLIKDKVKRKLSLEMKSEQVKSPEYIQIFSAPTLRTEGGIKEGLALDILIFLLKEGKDMLFNEIVEKQQIASSLRISYNTFGGDYAPLLIKANAENNEKLNLIETNINSFLKNNLKVLITDEVVQDAARMLGIDYVYMMDDIENRAEFLSYAALVKQIENPGEFLSNLSKELLKIKASDLHALVDKVFINGASTTGKILEESSAVEAKI